MTAVAVADAAAATAAGLTLDANSNSAAATITGGAVLDSSDPDKVRSWLKKHAHGKQLAVLDAFLQELRLKRLTLQQQQQAPAAAADNTTQQQQQQYADPRWTMVHKTVNLLRHMIGSTAWKTAAELLLLLRGLGRELQAAAGAREPATGNMVRRIMAAVREEAMREAQEAAAAVHNINNNDLLSPTTAAAANAVNAESSAGGGRLSLQSMLWALPEQHHHPVRSTSSSSGGNTMSGRPSSSRHLTTTTTGAQRQESLASEEEMKAGHDCYYPVSFYVSRPNLKAAVMEACQEIMTDLEDLHRNINEQVTNHIHAGEIILTCGSSKTVEMALKAAYGAKKQQNPFTVIVCGGNDDGSGDMARHLAAAGMETTLIEHAAIFAVMARVHKVLLPAHAVLANGGLVSASSGCNLVALAAHQRSVPVVCVTGLFKLCPVYPHEGQDTLQELVSPVPGVVADFDELEAFDRVELVNPLHDYIEPKLVSLYITNVGSFQPSFIYRLLAENYHSDDWQSFN